jgi:phosphatidylserine/phosphatidylglycerophosphate/cardiolipin synthase-like enzyme
VRLAGWRGDRQAPLLHAKMLLLADAQGEHWPDGDHWKFQPSRAWLGSANWTTAAENDHLEYGLWTDDEALVGQVAAFLLDLLMFSEPMDTGSDTPRPDLAAAEWDDEAFAEAMEHLRNHDDEWEPDF